jgi:hypothetical protein
MLPCVRSPSSQLQQVHFVFAEAKAASHLAWVLLRAFAAPQKKHWLPREQCRHLLLFVPEACA